MGDTDIWFPFFVNDYLGNTKALTLEEHGIYLLLICECWKNGSIKNDKNWICSYLGISTRSPLYAKICSLLTDFFVQNSSGAWENSRVNKEKKKASNRSKLATEKANKRWKKDDAAACSGHMQNACSSQSQSQSHNTLDIFKENLNNEPPRKLEEPPTTSPSDSYLNDTHIKPSGRQSTTKGHSRDMEDSKVEDLVNYYNSIFGKKYTNKLLEEQKTNLSRFMKNENLDYNLILETFKNREEIYKHPESRDVCQRHQRLDTFLSNSFNSYRPENFQMKNFLDLDRLKKISDNNKAQKLEKEIFNF